MATEMPEGVGWVEVCSIVGIRRPVILRTEVTVFLGLLGASSTMIRALVFVVTFWLTSLLSRRSA